METQDSATLRRGKVPRAEERRTHGQAHEGAATQIEDQDALVFLALFKTVGHDDHRERGHGAQQFDVGTRLVGKLLDD